VEENSRVEHLQAQGPSRTCNESKEEEEGAEAREGVDGAEEGEGEEGEEYQTQTPKHQA